MRCAGECWCYTEIDGTGGQWDKVLFWMIRERGVRARSGRGGEGETILTARDLNKTSQGEGGGDQGERVKLSSVVSVKC